MFQVPILFLTRIIQAILRQPFMQRLKAKYPRGYAFIRNRFDLNEFWGLPLTILLFLVSVNLAMFSELAEEAVNSSEMKNLDMEVSAWFFNQRRSPLSQAAYYFTQLGTTLGICLSTVLLGLILLWKKRAWYLLPLLAAVLGSGLSSRLSKLHFQRERPLHLAYYDPEATYSFPSGHATSSMALVGILCYFILLEVKNTRARVALCLAGAMYILLMGMSRIYLGVHFFTDVVAGYLLGLLWVLLAVGLLEYAAHKKRPRKRKSARPRQAYRKLKM
jgi:membrane-associated phospholipid phosphatase